MRVDAMSPRGCRSMWLSPKTASTTVPVRGLERRVIRPPVRTAASASIGSPRPTRRTFFVV